MAAHRAAVTSGAPGSIPAREPAARRGWWVVPALAVVPVGFLAALFVWPFSRVLAQGLSGRGPGALLDVLRDDWFAGVFVFTAWQALLSVVLTLAIGLPAAWVFARLRFVGRDVLWAALVVPFVMPTVVVASAFTNLLGPDGPVNRSLSTVGIGDSSAPALVAPGSLWVIVVAHAFFNVAVVVRVVGAAWASLDPALDESAAVLGASRWRTFREVTLPLLAPSVLGASAVVYLFTFTSFGVVLLLGAGRRRTVEVEIYEQVRSLDLTTAAALASVQLLVVVGVLLVTGRLAQRWSVGTIPATAAQRRPRGAAERLVLVATLAVLTVLLALPLGSLVVRSLRTNDGWALTYYRTLGDADRGSVLFVAPLEAVRNSVVLGLVAMGVALVVGVLATATIIAAERRRSRHGAARSWATGGFDALLTLPLGVSAVTIGLGFLLALDRPPLDLRDSVALVPLAQALVAVPFVVRTLLPAWRSLDQRLGEAAMVLGAAPWRVVWEIDRPLLARPVAVAAGFAFAIALGEFGATVLLAGPDVATLPLVVARLLGRPGELNRGQAMAASTILMVVTALVLLAVEHRRTPRVQR